MAKVEDHPGELFQGVSVLDQVWGPSRHSGGSLRRSLTETWARAFRNRTGNYLLVLTSDYEDVDFVLLERVLPATPEFLLLRPLPWPDLEGGLQ